MNKNSTEEKLHIFTKLSRLTPDKYFIFDVEQQEVTWLTKEADEAQRVLIKDIIHSEDLSKVLDSFAQARNMKDQDIATRIYRLKDTSGIYRWTHDCITVYQRDSSGAIKSIIGLATDFEDQNGPENAPHLAFEKILSITKMATTKEVARHIIHEINNPLTVIHARSFQLTQMVENNNINPEKINQIAESISATTDKIAQIVSSLRSKT